MRIGIDLDNTIICYNRVFALVGRKLGLLPRAFKGSKAAVKAHLLARNDGDETDWMRLQGQVYGAFINHAKPFPGVARFVARAAAAGAKPAIVSHKTKHGDFDAAAIDLREAALGWLVDHQIAGVPGAALEATDVHFEESRDAKVARIGALNFTHFIDDLPELFAHCDFPSATRGILFAPRSSRREAPPGVRVMASWHGIEAELLGG